MCTQVGWVEVLLLVLACFDRVIQSVGSQNSESFNHSNHTPAFSFRQNHQEGKSRTMTRRETPQEREARLCKAKGRSIRKLSAWNVFQRSKLKGRHLQGEAYHAEIKEISRQWRSLSAEAKEEYQVEAEHQQALLDALETTPLAVEAADDSERANTTDGVWRNAAKKRSARRLDLNEAAFRDNILWSLPTQLGDGAMAVLVSQKYLRQSQHLSHSVTVC